MLAIGIFGNTGGVAKCARGQNAAHVAQMHNIYTQYKHRFDVVFDVDIHNTFDNVAGWLGAWLPGCLAAWLDGWVAGCLAG